VALLPAKRPVIYGGAASQCRTGAPAVGELVEATGPITST
jgi:hypothetical protein